MFAGGAARSIVAAMRSSILVSSFASVLLVACGSSLSEEDTLRAFAAMSTALGAGQAEANTAASTGAAAQADDAVAFRAGGSAAVDYTWNCTGGGSVRFAGAAEAAGEADVVAANFTLASSFDGCAVTDITIDGDLDYAGAVSVDGGSVATTFTFKGDLAFSGAVDGSCEFDFSFKAGASDAASGSAYAEVSGSLCGHKASGLFKT